MSGIFAALRSSLDLSYVTDIEKLLSRSKDRGADGTRTVLRTSSGWRNLGTGDRFPKPLIDLFEDVSGVIGCAYSHPVSLEPKDHGPFIGKHMSVAYDGVISGVRGNDVVKYLEDGAATVHWDHLVSRLEGQFAIVMLSERRPERIYYATKAKPLYVLYDCLARGIMVASSREAFRGSYHPIRNPQPVELDPYSSGYITIGGQIFSGQPLYMHSGEGSLVLCGGGLDSLVAAWDVKQRFPNERMELLYLDYLAKARDQEMFATTRIAGSLLSRFPKSSTVVSIRTADVIRRLTASSITDDELEVSTNPTPGKASEWLPARNTVLMSLGLAYAESNGYARIVVGVNQDAAAAYPDNDGEWVNRFQRLVPYAVGTGRQIRLVAPLSMMSKVDIVRHGQGLRIPWEDAASWSCYERGDTHCGVCSSCRARRRAFQLAKVTDPTEYAV